MRFWQEHSWLFIDGTRNLEHLCLFSYFLELPCIISPQSPLSLALRFKNWVSDSNVVIEMFGNRERERCIECRQGSGFLILMWLL